MQNLSLFLALAIVLAPAAAHAEAPSRAARLLSLGADVEAVLVASDQAWFPANNGAPLAVCAGARCAPVVSIESCAPPRCPGVGSVARLERAIADVSGFSTDREGFGREVERLRTDPALGALAWSYGVHPEPPPGPPEPARFAAGRHLGLGWELDAVLMGGGLGVSGVGLAGGEISLGFRFAWEAHGDDDEFVMVMIGNVIGGDLRVRTFALMPSQTASVWAVSIGIAPSMGAAPQGESFRLPSVYGTMFPEFGVVFREDRGPAWYAGWTLPVTLLVDPHVGVELRATVLLIEDWAVNEDEVEALLTLGVGIVLR